MSDFLFNATARVRRLCGGYEAEQPCRMLLEESKPRRIHLSRARGWRMPANTVKVCRPTKYGNPHRVGFCPVCGVEHTQEEAVAEFRAMLELADIPVDLSDLRGKNLACWCKLGTPCHADVLLEIANS